MATLSVAAILAENARRRPHKTALVEGGLRLTFAEVWQRALAQAGALTGLGVRPGDRVALMAPNTAEFPVAYYAIAAAGAVVVPVHLLLSAGEVEHVLRDSEATLLLVHPGQAETGTAAARATGVRAVVLGGELLVLLPRFDAARAIELMVEEGVNTFHGVPTMFLALAAAAADAGRLPELRVCVSGGAA
ncbi:AMP-binding protein, partial [Streptomyces capoamus]